MAHKQPTELTPFSADPADELPVGTQLSWRLRALVASGRLSAGDRLPSVRALAGWAGVNVNTVRAVYARLEEEGLVVSQHGLGTFVAAGAPSSPELERIAAEAIEEAREAGLSARDLAMVAHVCASVPAALAEGLGPEAPTELPPLPELPEIDHADERGARRELRRQIARLEAELASYLRDLPRDRGGRPRRREAHVAGIEELEAVRDLLLDQLRDARAGASERASREGLARERREAMVADPAAHRGVVISSEDTGEPGSVSWAVEPRYGPLGVLMNWWRVKVSGGN